MTNASTSTIQTQAAEVHKRFDDYKGEIPFQIPAAKLQELSRIHPFVNILYLIGEWASIAAAIWISSRIRPTLWWVVGYVFAVVWIGARQHDLLILMHEGSHYLLFKKYRRLNDVITEVFFAWPHFLSMVPYRQDHWAHHRDPNSHYDINYVSSMQDPRIKNEWQFPMRWKKLGTILLKDFLALNTRQQLMALNDFLTGRNRSGESDTAFSRGLAVFRIIYYALIAFAVWYFHLIPTVLLYWVVPLFTWLKVVLRIRDIARHFGIPGNDTGLMATRTTIPRWFDLIFVAGLNVGYHFEHHLYPGVPFYNIPKLHAELMKVPHYRERVHMTRSYVGVVREITSGRPQPISS